MERSWARERQCKANVTPNPLDPSVVYMTAATSPFDSLLLSELFQPLLALILYDPGILYFSDNGRKIGQFHSPTVDG